MPSSLYAILFVVSLCLVNSSSQTLFDLLVSKEKIVTDIAEQVKTLYAQRCSFPCNCSFTACRSDLVGAVCDETRGNVNSTCSSIGACGSKRLMNFEASAIRVYNGIDQLDSTKVNFNKVLKTEECWTQGLDETFKKYQNESTVTWQYFGTSEGILRGYPGNSRNECSKYDPRTRPWYVGAASGPKDVILIIDVSGSMGGGTTVPGKSRMDLAKAAAASVLGTLTIADYVQVVAFDSSGRYVVSNPASFGDGRPANILRNGTAANIAVFQAAVANLAPGSSTNYSAGFELAFNTLTLSRADEVSSGCQPVIIFLTDGEPTVAPVTQTELVDFVTTRNTENAIVVSFTVGADTKGEIVKAMSCSANGVFNAITDPQNLVSEMTNYYRYVAALRNPTISYVEPYVDTSGAGLLTSCSIAVYDPDTQFDPPAFIGVVSLSYQMSVLQAQSADAIPAAQLLSLLSGRSKVCGAKNFTRCQLEQLRFLSGGINATCDAAYFNSVCTKPEVAPKDCIQNQNIKPFCSDLPNTYNLVAQTCCATCGPTNPQPTTSGPIGPGGQAASASLARVSSMALALVLFVELFMLF